jgi:2-phospho-L-lactate guanylyltransferase
VRVEHKLPEARCAAGGDAYAHPVLAIVPVKGLDGAKSRLSAVLTPPERRQLVLEMLERVLDACRAAEVIERTLLVTPEPELAPADVDVLVDEGRGHAAALAAALADPRAQCGALVVMADCPLVRAESLDALAAAARPVALAPAGDGGVNALAARGPLGFDPAFGHPDGAALTIARARAAGIEPAVVADPLLALDVDCPEDHAAVLSRRPR